MSTYDDPNREAVGLEPIWTGAGDTAEPHEVQDEPDDEVHETPMEDDTEDE